MIVIEASHLRGVVSDDRRTEHRLYEEFQCQAGAAAASLIRQLLHCSEHFLQSRIICHSYTHPEQGHIQAVYSCLLRYKVEHIVFTHAAHNMHTDLGKSE